MGKFLGKFFKTITMTIFSSLVACGLLYGSYKVVLGAYHDFQPHIVAQYGPRQTQSGSTVTVVLVEKDFFDSYRLSVWITNGEMTYERDILDDSFRTTDEMKNHFVEYMDNVKRGFYEGA